jgi:ribose transport system substrate-binding protein
MRKVFVVLMALAIAGCGGSRSGGAPQTKKLRFAVIPKSLDIPVFNYAKIGAERKAKELGDVEILWNAPTNADQLKQKEILESYITQGVDGIAISALNGDFLTDTINRAIDAGIPVVTWDSDAPKSKRLAFYGVDDFASGKIMGEQAIALLDGKGKVAIITSMGATNLQRRLDGIKDALAKAPGIQVVETFDIKEDVVRCAEIISTGTARYPDLGAWLSVGGWPVFTRNATAAIDPAKTKVISFDTIQPALDLLREGKVTVLLGQKYFGWGSEPVQILYDIKHGKNPPSPIIDSGVDVVTKDNVDEYEAKWKKMESGT